MCWIIEIGRYKIDIVFEVFLNINELWYIVKYIIIEINILFKKKLWLIKRIMV